MSLEHTNKQERGPNRDDLKHVQQNLQAMRNRVQLLRSQLQKQKDTIHKHKSMTEDMIRRKVQISKISSLRKKDSNSISQQISQLRQRNHSYREMHKQQMNNILKAVYLVKLDEARQMKSLAHQNRTLLQQRQQKLKVQQRQRQRDLAMQSENAKKNYIQFWKQKLNQVYSSGQRDQIQVEMEAQQRKRQLKQLQQQELQLLEEINNMHHEHTEAKKEYLAALTLSSREVVEAVGRKEDGRREKSPRSLEKLVERDREREWEEKLERLEGNKAEVRYKDKKIVEEQFWSKSPHVSMMSRHDLSMPRANVDQDKLKIILKELKKLQATDKK